MSYNYNPQQPPAPIVPDGASEAITIFLSYNGHRQTRTFATTVETHPNGCRASSKVFFAIRDLINESERDPFHMLQLEAHWRDEKELAYLSVTSMNLPNVVVCSLRRLFVDSYASDLYHLFEIMLENWERTHN